MTLGAAVSNRPEASPLLKPTESEPVSRQRREGEDREVPFLAPVASGDLVLDADVLLGPQILMPALLLSTPGVGLRVNGRELWIVESGGKVAARYRPYRTGFDQVLVEENGGYATFAPILWLSAQGIPFAGVAFNGRLEFCTAPVAPNSGPVKLAHRILLTVCGA